jgi:PAS domain S-box-containing protein
MFNVDAVKSDNAKAPFFISLLQPPQKEGSDVRRSGRLKGTGIQLLMPPNVRRSEEVRLLYSSIVESSDDVIIAKSREGVISAWNPAAQRMFGYTEKEAIGQPITIIIPSDLHNEENDILRRLLAGERIEHYETRRVSKTGTNIDLSITFSPIRDARGTIIAVSSIARDITERKRAEAALRESEERFRLVANTAPVMIWMSGIDNLCTYFNQGWLEFTGRYLEEELGNGWAEGVHPDDLRRCLETYTKAFYRRERYDIEYRLRRRDGEYRWILATGVPRFSVDNSFAGYIGSAIDVTEHKLAEEALSTVGQKLIEAHEEERTRIARELHDDISQRLALLSGELASLKRGRAVLAAEVGNQVADLASDIQALSHRLHPPKLEYLGLAAAAAGFCRELPERHRVEIDFHSENIPKELPREISLCLFRVLQEALQNAIKHSGSRQFQVSLRGGANEVELTVHDSGVGFEPEEALRGRGLGLTSMQERLKLVDGQLSINSKPQSGTTIQARVPFGATMKAAGANG